VSYELCQRKILRRKYINVHVSGEGWQNKAARLKKFLPILLRAASKNRHLKTDINRLRYFYSKL
jgi:hypothetical protein